MNRKRFNQLLVNTFLANLTTSYLWFALTFWVYLETRSVLATAFIGGSYMLLIAVVGVPSRTTVVLSGLPAASTGTTSTRCRTRSAAPSCACCQARRQRRSAC